MEETQNPSSGAFPSTYLPWQRSGPAAGEAYSTSSAIPRDAASPGWHRFSSPLFPSCSCTLLIAVTDNTHPAAPAAIAKGGTRHTKESFLIKLAAMGVLSPASGWQEPACLQPPALPRKCFIGYGHSSTQGCWWEILSLYTPLPSVRPHCPMGNGEGTGKILAGIRNHSRSRHHPSARAFN